MVTKIRACGEIGPSSTRPTLENWHVDVLLACQKACNVAALEVGNLVSRSNLDALHKLQRHGYQVFLVSYGGWQRNQQTDAAAAQLWQVGLLAFLSRTGMVCAHGKCMCSRRRDISVILDDNKEILEECATSGWPPTRWPPATKSTSGAAMLLLLLHGLFVKETSRHTLPLHQL